MCFWESAIIQVSVLIILAVIKHQGVTGESSRTSKCHTTEPLSCWLLHTEQRIGLLLFWEQKTQKSILQNDPGLENPRSHPDPREIQLLGAC